MKKLILILALIMLSITTYGQDFNRWAVSGEVGNQLVSDKTAVSVDNYVHFGISGRYNVNEIVGFGLTAGYDNTSLSDEIFTEQGSYFGPEYDFEYWRVNAEAYVNAFKVVDLYSKRWTVLFHGGPGVSHISTNGDRLDKFDYLVPFNHNETVFNLRGGATLLFKISPKVVAYADVSTTSNINQKYRFDGGNKVSNTGVNVNITNVSVGLTMYLGKKGKEHADWYVAEPIKPTVTHVTTINDYPVTEVTKIIEKPCDCKTEPTSEYVFFDHDKFDIKETELNSIYKVFAELDNNPTFKLVIKGYASPTSSSDEYNLKLSENRSNILFKKFVAMGIDESRITFEYFGKDKERKDEFVHDVARRVELLVKQ